jgi:hypothetical protein
VSNNEARIFFLILELYAEIIHQPLKFIGAFGGMESQPLRFVVAVPTKQYSGVCICCSGISLQTTTTYTAEVIKYSETTFIICSCTPIFSEQPEVKTEYGYLAYTGFCP